MTSNSPLPAPSPWDVQFQVSLLRLMYPESVASTKVAELERLLAPPSPVPAHAQ